MNRSIMMTWLGCLLWLASTESSLSESGNVQIFLSESSKPGKEGAYWVGQKVPVIVEVLSETHFSGSTRFSLPDIAGAVFYKPEERAIVMSRQIDGRSFSVQRHEFAFYPQRPGKFVVPSFSVRFGIAGQVGEEPTEYNEKTGPLTIHAMMPPGAEGLASVISATDLKVTESWSPDPSGLDGPLTAGNAIKRSITFRAADTPGMVFPELRISEAQGLKIYRNRAEVRDQMNRGSLIGERVDSLTYVCEKPGSYQLPAIQIQWWDLDQKELKTITLPGVTFEVSGAPDQSLAVEGGATKDSGLWKWGCGVVFAIVIGLGYFFRKRIMGRWYQWQQQRQESEATYFKRIHVNLSPSEMYDAIQQWLVRLPNHCAGQTLMALAAEHEAPELLKEYQLLQQALVGRNEQWSGGGLYTELKMLRLLLNGKDGLKASEHKKLTLGELNPK